MNTNRICPRKALYVLVIVIFIFGIYVLPKAQSPMSSVLVDDEKEEHKPLGQLVPLACSASGTVLDITGQVVAVQGTSPYTIDFVYIKGGLPPGLAPGKTVDVRGKLKNGLIYTDHIPITGGTPWTSPVTPPQRGLLDSVIFYMAYELL